MGVLVSGGEASERFLLGVHLGLKYVEVAGEVLPGHFVR